MIISAAPMDCTPVLIRTSTENSSSCFREGNAAPLLFSAQFSTEMLWVPWPSLKTNLGSLRPQIVRTSVSTEIFSKIHIANLGKQVVDHLDRISGHPADHSSDRDRLGMIFEDGNLSSCRVHTHCWSMSTITLLMDEYWIIIIWIRTHQRLKIMIRTQTLHWWDVWKEFGKPRDIFECFTRCLVAESRWQSHLNCLRQWCSVVLFCLWIFRTPGTPLELLITPCKNFRGPRDLAVGMSEFALATVTIPPTIRI